MSAAADELGALAVTLLLLPPTHASIGQSLKARIARKTPAMMGR